MDQDKDLTDFLNSGRYGHIKRTQELAIFYGRCKETLDGKCMYPHCQCLHGANGPTDPVTGKEYV